MGRQKKSKKAQFNGQRDDEEVLHVFRRHLIAMRKGFYCLLIPFAVSAIPPLIWQSKFELFLLPIAGLLIGLILFSYHFLMWFYTYYIVTDQRIRQVTQKGFFGTDVIELQLSKVQNISYNIPGFFGEAFHFGTIVIQTFVGDLVIRNVDHPEVTYNKLQDAIILIANQQEDHEEIINQTA